MLLAFLLATIVIWSIPHVSSSILDLTVFTSNPSYIVTEDITIFGDLAYDGSPVPNWPVAIEVQDPLGTLVLTRTPQTNASGTYTLTFKLPTDATIGTYTVYASASYKGERATDSTTFELLVHDIAVTNVTTCKDGCKPFPSVGQNYLFHVNVTVANQGDYAETFNVTLYADSTVINQTQLVVPSLTSTIFTFRQNATSAYGNYSISAVADTVPNEANSTNNTFTGSTIEVTIPGDVDGSLWVKGPDLNKLLVAYGSPQNPAKPYNPNADINDDHKITGPDLNILLNHYGQHYP